jgi:replicative DNA helicase
MITCDASAEVLFIRVLCSTELPIKIKSELLLSVSADHFGFKLSREAYSRLLSLARQRAEFPQFVELLADPALSTDVKEFLKERSPRRVKITMTLMRSLVETLHTYRRIRIVSEVSGMMATGLSQDGIDVNKLLDTAVVQLNTAKLSALSEETVYHFGIDDNTDDLVESVLNGGGDLLYPTGFTEYDDQVGGLPCEGVFLMAGTTSAGKSTIVNVLLARLYLLNNLKVVKVTLEMSERQETRRLLSFLSQIPYHKFVRGQLTPGEAQLAKHKRQEFKEHGTTNDCRFSIWAPTVNLNLDKILLMLQPFGYNVIAIDYITLLDGTSDANQWLVLSEIVRRCKAFSRRTHTLIILLAQLDEDSDKVRYARAMKEHADVCWTFNYSKKEQRDSRILPIKVVKARDAQVGSFELAERFDIMSVENMVQDGSSSRFGHRSSHQDDDSPVRADEDLDTETGEVTKKERGSSKSRSSNRGKKTETKIKPVSYSRRTVNPVAAPSSPDDELDINETSELQYEQNGIS